MVKGFIKILILFNFYATEYRTYWWNRSSNVNFERQNPVQHIVIINLLMDRSLTEPMYGMNYLKSLQTGALHRQPEGYKVTETTVSLSWDESTDNVAVIGYDYRDGIRIGHLTNTPGYKVLLIPIYVLLLHMT